MEERVLCVGFGLYAPFWLQPRPRDTSPAWDHFSKAQRKNLDTWRKQVEEIRNIHNEQLMGIRGEEEMEMSDDDMEDSSPANSKDSEDSVYRSILSANTEHTTVVFGKRHGVFVYACVHACVQVRLFVSVDNIPHPGNSRQIDVGIGQYLAKLFGFPWAARCFPSRSLKGGERLSALPAGRLQERGGAAQTGTQARTNQSTVKEDNTHSQQLSFLQQALQGMQKQLLRMRDQLKEREVELEKSIEDKQKLKNQIQDLKAGLHNLQTTQTLQLEMLKRDDRKSEQSANQVSDVTASSVVSCSQEKEGLPEKKPPSPVHSERDALLVGIISTFLNVHPFGASIEYICSYLQRLDTKINPGEVEALLSRLPCTFRQELTGVGASLEKRWNFCGFQGIKST
ncbi:Ecto-NOX disulfide-thiol exchanger 2 [Larimichthys crocea]|uniref:Uncharacterized protein n=1 Tax=Larimichthys crocea TaxID=215358 RepID=A0ACD3RDP3_LARCR|nr:Ecto-NOX disulfide-thiol exchanger 2 [Larimichthys crocea]